MAGLAESDKIKRGVGDGSKEATSHVKVTSLKTMAACNVQLSSQPGVKFLA